MTTQTKVKRFRPLRFLAWSLLGLFLVGSILLLVVPRFIPWDKLKQQAEAKISQIIHHTVTIDSIGFNLLRGVEIKNLRIANAADFSPKPLLQDEAVIIRYRLLPLLVGKLFIKTVELDRPQLLLERKADGRFNFSDMLPAKTGEIKTAQPTPTVSKPVKLPVELLVSQVMIKEASLTYRDRAQKQEYQVKDFNLKISNLTLAGLKPADMELDAQVKALGQTIPIRFNSQWRFNYNQEKFFLDKAVLDVPGIQATAQGEINELFGALKMQLSGTTQLDFNLIIQQLIPPLIRQKIPKDLKLTGTMKIQFQVQGSAKNLAALKAQVGNQISLKIQTLGLEIPFAGEGNIHLAESNLSLKQKADLPGVKAELSAHLKDLFKQRAFQATSQSHLNLGEMFANYLPAELKKKLAQVTASGKVQVDARVQGLVAAPKKMEFQVQIKLAQAQAAYQGKTLLEKGSLQLILNPQRIEMAPFTAQLAGHTLQAGLKAEGFDLRDPATLKPKQLRARVNWNVASDLLDLDAILALLPKPAEKTSTTAKPEKPVPVSQDLPEPEVSKFMPAGLEMKGQAQLGGLKFGKVKLGRLQSEMSLKQRQLTSRNDLQGYSGQIQNTTQLNFSQKLLGYQIVSQIKDVDVEPLLNDIVDTFLAAKLKKPELISEIKSKLVGRLTSTVELSGQGLRPQHAKPNLKGQGKFNLKNSRIRQFSFQAQLAQWFGSDKFKQDIPFDRVEGNFKIAQQKVDLIDFVAESGPKGESGDIRMNAKGQLTFKADFQNMRLHPRLNPRAATHLSPEFNQYSEILKDDRGWTTIPVVMNGPIKKPDVQPDWDWIKGQFGRYLEQKAKKTSKAAEQKVKTLVDQQKGKSPEEVKKNLNQEVEKTKEQLKNLNLNNLFK